MAKKRFEGAISAQHGAIPVATCFLPTSASLSARLEERIPQTSAAHAVAGRRSRLSRERPKTIAPHQEPRRGAEDGPKSERGTEKERETKQPRARAKQLSSHGAKQKQGPAPTDSAVEGWGGTGVSILHNGPAIRDAAAAAKRRPAGHGRERDNYGARTTAKRGKKQDASRLPPERERLIREAWIVFTLAFALGAH